MISFRGNPVCEVVKDPNRDWITKKTKKEIEKLNNFRHLYYCLKFKTRFRDWLWVKVIEPNVMKKYAPSYLVENLHEEADLDDILLNW